MTKTIIYSIVITVMFGMVTYSCNDFLEQTPPGKLNKQKVTNAKGVEDLLTGAYFALTGQVDGVGGAPAQKDVSDWPYGGVGSDVLHKGSEPGDQQPMNQFEKSNTSPTNVYLDNKWRALYEGVRRANNVLNVLKDVKDVSDGKRIDIKAEARFLRGHFYFELTKMWNRVPWIDENTSNLNQPNPEPVWGHIEKDFTFAMNNLPETQDNVGHANKWAAASYLAKTYVFEHKWDKAKPLLDNIIKNGQTSNGLAYALTNNYEDNFDPATENNSETVFTVQFTNTADGGGSAAWSGISGWGKPYGGPFPCCGFIQPTLNLVNSYRTNPNTGLPYLYDYNNTMVKNDLGVSSSDHFTPYTGTLDPRLDRTVGRRGVPYQDWGPWAGEAWVRDQAFSGPYYGRKWIIYHSQQGKYAYNKWTTSLNYNIIRFAQVLLWAAEADVELGDLNEARILVNKVRKRAKNSTWVSYKDNIPYAKAVVNNQADMLQTDASPGDWVVRTDLKATFVLLKGDPGDINNWNEYKDPNYKIGLYPPGSPVFSSQNKARKAVYFEEKLELATEGHRLFDLVRWNKAEKIMNAYYAFESQYLPNVQGGHFDTPKDRYYPIPQNEIDLSVKNGEPILKQNPGYR